MFTPDKGQRGEAAVLEAAVILPLVFSVLVTLLGFTLYLCDSARMKALAEKYAALAALETRLPGAAAAVLQREENPDDGWNQNTVAFVERDRQNTRLFPSVPEYGFLQNALTAEAERTSFLHGGSFGCSISCEEKVLSGYVRVTVTRSAEGSAFFRLFPSDSAVAVARVGDCSETVRNVDLIADAAEDVAARWKKEGGIGDALAKIFRKE